MPRNDDIQHSILIVSAKEKFKDDIKRSLNNYMTLELAASGALARRMSLERFYDLVIINIPLPDETGEELALDIAQSCDASVLLAVPGENYIDVLEHVTDQGILAVSKPVSSEILDKAVRYLMAIEDRIRKLQRKNEKLEEKLEETRLVSKAKLLLIEKKHMNEEEAHRFIGRNAMNLGLSRKRIAQKVIDDLE